MVFRRDPSNHLRLMAGSRAALRLVHDVDEGGRLSEAAMRHTLEALRDFKAIATAAGARRIVAVATAAMRDASNGAQFTRRVARELGIRIRVIDALTEARYGFAGAVRGLTVSDGLLFDLGGGSLEVTRFARRRSAEAVSLPLGALRSSERFLESDPPTSKQMRRLRDHVRTALEVARVGRLTRIERLVGTGGTLRNLARIDGHFRGEVPGRIHGYVLSLDRLAEIVDRLANVRLRKRDEIPGLSADRADSIVGGAVVIQILGELVRASDILVSGQGVREGVALEVLKMPIGTPEAVREASLSSLVSRFDGWRAEAAARRRSVAAALQRVLQPRADATITRALDWASRILDIGRSVDVLNRHEHVAGILLATDLDGFTDEDLTLLAAIVRRSGDRHADIGPLRSASGPLDPLHVDRAAIVLSLADEIEARSRRGPIKVTCAVRRGVTLSVPMLPSWGEEDLSRRFERAFGKALVVKTGRPWRSRQD